MKQEIDALNVPFILAPASIYLLNTSQTDVYEKKTEKNHKSHKFFIILHRRWEPIFNEETLKYDDCKRYKIAQNQLLKIAFMLINFHAESLYCNKR